MSGGYHQRGGFLRWIARSGTGEETINRSTSSRNSIPGIGALGSSHFSRSMTPNWECEMRFQSTLITAFEPGSTKRHGPGSTCAGTICARPATGATASNSRATLIVNLRITYIIVSAAPAPGCTPPARSCIIERALGRAENDTIP